MSKRMKKLISMLLSLMMVLSSIGITVFADEITADADAVTDEATATQEQETVEDTVATEATAEPTEAPTPEPTPEPTPAPYEGDVYYERALSLCSTLGIIQGYDDGSVKPESTVTRAEMAAIILRMLNTTASNTYANSFNDVTAEHWAADTIQTAANLGIIAGMGDGSFLPDGNVMYEQVAKMIICALGYETDAKLDGGYPGGYLNMVKNLEINDNAEGAQGVVAQRGTVIKLVYNALLTKVNEMSGLNGLGKPVYDATRTLAKAKFGVIDSEGMLTATHKRSVSASNAELLENQIAIDGSIYETELTGLEEFVGTEVTFFYMDDYDFVPTVVAVITATTKSETVEIDPADVDRIENIETANGMIYTAGGKDYKCNIKQIVYNDEIVTSADYAKAVADDAAALTSEYRFYERDILGNIVGSKAMSFEEFLLPKVGTIKLTDTNDDRIYDYMFVDSYDTMVVTSVGSKKLTGNINGTQASFNIDETINTDLNISVVRAGTEAKPRNLKKDDVVSLKRNFDNTKMTMIVTGETIIGRISAIQDRDDARYIEFGDTEYAVDANAADDAKSGADATLYLDMFGRVGRIESSVSGKLSGSEKYAWVMKAYKSDNQEDIVLEMYTQEGKAQAYTLANSLTYWGPTDKAVKKLAGDGRQAILTDLAGNSPKYVLCDTYQIRLCRIKTNVKNEITSLYVAVDSSAVSNDDALIVDTKNLRGVSSVGSQINGHFLRDGVVGFTIPKSTDDMRLASEYSVFEVSASSYLNSQGVQIDFITGEYDKDNSSSILIRYKDGSSTPASSTDYGSASDNPCMVVSGIGTGVNKDGDTIYTIKGMRGGSEVRYTTTLTTSLSEIDDTDVFEGSKPFPYKTETIWKGNDGKPITDYLKVGDVIGVAGSGEANIIIKMADVDKIAKVAAGEVSTEVGQFVGYQCKSESRDGIAIGAVANISNDDSTYFSLVKSDGSNLKDWVLSSSTSVDIVEITTNEAGVPTDVKVTKDVIEPSELVELELNGSKAVGDFMFFRHFKNDAQREVIVYRFNY